MARRKQLPARNNPLPLIAAPLAIGVLKATGIALVGAIGGTAAYSKYVATAEEEKRKDLPRIAETLENNIQNLRDGRSVDDSMPTSMWLAPTDDAQASLRVAWLYMLAAIKNPQHRTDLLDLSQAELDEYYDLEQKFGQSFEPNAPELQYAYEDMIDVFQTLGVTGIDKYLTGVTITQKPDEINWQMGFEKKQKDDASLLNALKKTGDDLYEAGSDFAKGGKCGAELALGLLTGKNPPACNFTTWQWLRVRAMIYGGVGLVAAAYILPPIFRVAAPIIERVLDKD